MVASAAIARVSPEAYLAAELLAVEKHEYWRGDVFAMSGASLRHNILVGNLVGELRTGLRGQPCVALPSDMKIHVPAKPGFVYPDVSVVCGEAQFYADNSHVITNPSVIVEVLSKRTEAFDRGEKFDGYASIASVQDVVLVSQLERKVEVFSRQADGAWLLRISRAHEAAVLPSLALGLGLDEIYARVFDVPGDTESASSGT